ncbi:tol-pal system protein YbgF [Thiobacillus sp. 0-1251]|uniref:tol-pal system protein YbgF n=1 Tax=Thiobacillus sp. 0-1251 TaxID=1895858 RepID=UPI000AFE41FE|nr:tol-pal system protein YbgF [Thiobacillus sp. 0-1251]
MTSLRRNGLILVAMLMLAQPAWAALFGNDEEVTRQMQALQQRVDALDARLAKLEQSIQQNQPMLDMLKEVESLKAEVARLRGQSEVQANQLDTLGKRQNDLYADLDQRIVELAKAAKPAPAADATQPAAPDSQAAAGTVAKPAADGAAQADPLAESRSYEGALALFRDAKYTDAIAGFKNFLKTYPASTLAANAQYWIGYSYYALKDYKTSLAHQQKLVATYPDSPKVPDALLNVATNQIELDDMAAARKTLKDLVAKHPGTPAAKLAARRLAAIK